MSGCSFWKIHCLNLMNVSIVVIVLKKRNPKSNIIVPCKIELMFLSPQNDRIRYIRVS